MKPVALILDNGTVRVVRRRMDKILYGGVRIHIGFGQVEEVVDRKLTLPLNARLAYPVGVHSHLYPDLA